MSGVSDVVLHSLWMVIDVKHAGRFVLHAHNLST